MNSAATAQDKKTAEEMIDILRFTIDKEEYGIDLLKVQTIIRLPHITNLPKAPKFVKGIINLRGAVIPIIDLREKFGLETLEYGSTTRAIIVEINGRTTGIVVDRVSQVVKIDKSKIQDSPVVVGGIASDFIEGVSELGEELIILLKIERILSEEEVIELDKVNPAEAAE